MNKLGMHIHGVKPGIIEAVALLQPQTITIMDPKPEEIRAIRDASPEIFIVMRKYEDGRGWRDTDPFVWAEQCYSMSQGLADGVVGWNEPFGHDDRGSCAPFDEWSYCFASACKQLGTMEAVVLCMATGNWTGAADRYKITDDFPLTCNSAKYFGPHEYSWPSLEAGQGWYALRFKAWVEDLKAFGRDDDFWFIISEAGLTQAVIASRDDVGWRSGGPEGVTEDSYIATLDWYNARLCEVPECLGCCLFDYAGQWYEWPTFEQLGLEQRIYRIQAPVPEPPEPPAPEPEPNGGEPMDYRVFDIDGNELFGEEAADLVAYHGITIHEPKGLREGEWYWAVVKLEEREGPACFIYTGLLEDGTPAVGQEAAWAWTDDMGEADEILGDNYPTDWQKQADLGNLNENGNIGPGFGQSGWYHDPYEPGPGRAWVRDELRWSVLLTGIGMLGMTNHRTMYGTWQLKQWQNGGEPEPPENGTLEKILKVLEDIRDILRGWGGVPAPPETPETPFQGEYYNNPDLEGEPVLTRDDEKIDFDWGNGSPAPEITEDQFSVRWTGERTFKDKLYIFRVCADDGVRLWVDGLLIIDQWHDQAPTIYEAPMKLSAGVHTIRMEYYEMGGNATAMLEWE